MVAPLSEGFQPQKHVIIKGYQKVTIENVLGKGSEKQIGKKYGPLPNPPRTKIN